MYKLYNLQYESLDGEIINPSRYGIKLDGEVKVDEYITYNGFLLLVRKVTGYLVEAIEQEGVIHIGRD